MGSLDVASYSPLAAALVPMAIACVRDAAALLLISVGSESAAARGAHVEGGNVALVSASLATGAAVSLAGPVSFVGIIVPHLVR
jgi:iron complex transport system permease protein